MSVIREILYQYQKEVTQRQISKSLGLSRDTIRKYIDLAKEENFNHEVTDAELNAIAIKIETKLYKKKTSQKKSAMSVLQQHKAEIENLLSESNITHTQIHRLLLEGVSEVSVRSLNRFIKKEYPRYCKSTIHIKTEPGKEGQVDFGYVGYICDVDGRLRKTYAFVMALSHSRYRYVEFVFSQDQVTWIKLHINAFEFFGGVPSHIILDNLKAGVIKPNIYDPTLNESYSELSRFYGFTIDPAKAYKPEHKGKVERSIRIVKEQLIAGKSYKNIVEANQEAKLWCKDKISHRVCSTTGSKPIDIFNLEEKSCLIKLPNDNFDIAIWSSGKVHKDHHFRADNNFYSVPTEYIGEEITIRIGLKTVSAYYKHQVIKTHPRNYNKGQWITDEKDYPKSARYYLENTAKKCKESAQEIGDATYDVINKILGDSGSKTSLRKAQAIIRLADKYGMNRLEAACLRAVTFENYDYKTIANILEKKIDKQSSESFGTKKIPLDRNNSFIRDAEEYSSDMEVNYA